MPPPRPRQNPGEYPVFQAGATNSYAPLVDTSVIDSVSWVAPQLLARAPTTQLAVPVPPCPSFYNEACWGGPDTLLAAWYDNISTAAASGGGFQTVTAVRHATICWTESSAALYLIRWLLSTASLPTDGGGD